mmetsp:Transcript_52189/g.138589  ORF Transcript_52189/g.138589 Transcript_52189/m.138589 type:complete len:101 (+) Transcript_52189:25-327(+)
MVRHMIVHNNNQGSKVFFKNKEGEYVEVDPSQYTQSDKTALIKELPYYREREKTTLPNFVCLNYKDGGWCGSLGGWDCTKTESGASNKKISITPGAVPTT